MTSRNIRFHRCLIWSIPFLMTGCNPSIYFSTGTTVGLEATPPVNETPPTITFGYKRVELALVPVPKPGESVPKPGKEQPPSPRKMRGCAEQAGPTQKGEGSTPPSAPNAGKPSPSGVAPDKSAGSVTKAEDKSPPATSTQAGTAPNLNSEDAYSVLAVFNLALNWFGPAKIEQHFVTGCAASHLVRGLTEAEEDKRGAQEAQSEGLAAKQQAANTEKKVNELGKTAATLQTAAETAKADSNEASEDAKKTTDKSSFDAAKKKAEKADLNAQTTLNSIAESLAEADKHNNRLEEAREKAKGAIQTANKAKRSEEARAKAQKAMEDAQKSLEDIEIKIDTLSTKIGDATARLKKAQAAAGDAKKTASDVRDQIWQSPPSK